MTAPARRGAAFLFPLVLAAACGCGPVVIGRTEFIDATGDGLYDYLEVPVKLTIEEAGTYVLTTELRLNRGPRTGLRTARMSSSMEMKLPPGVEWRFPRFDAAQLKQNGYAGRYRIYAELMRATEELTPAEGPEPAPPDAADAPPRLRRPPFTTIARHSGLTRRIPLEQCSTWKDQPRIGLE
jgi:hypothetical protein